MRVWGRESRARQIEKLLKNETYEIHLRLIWATRGHDYSQLASASIQTQHVLKANSRVTLLMRKLDLGAPIISLHLFGRRN